MQSSFYLKGVLVGAFLSAGLGIAPLCLTALAQAPRDAAAKPAEAAGPGGNAALLAEEAQGIPPRTGPNDYQSRVQVGGITIAVDYDQHGIPTPDATYSSEDYVTVEVGFFGPAGKRLNFNYQDFSLRINRRKNPNPASPSLEVFGSLKDPSWIPPEPVEKSSKTSFGGGGGNNGDPPPAPPKMPFELRRAMEQRVKRASLPVGEHPLPQDGLLFFQYGGKADKIRSIELIYNGPAGKATIPLQP